MTKNRTFNQNNPVSNELDDQRIAPNEEQSAGIGIAMDYYYTNQSGQPYQPSHIQTPLYANNHMLQVSDPIIPVNNQFYFAPYNLPAQSTLNRDQETISLGNTPPVSVFNDQQLPEIVELYDSRNEFSAEFIQNVAENNGFGFDDVYLVTTLLDNNLKMNSPYFPIKKTSITDKEEFIKALLEIMSFGCTQYQIATKPQYKNLNFSYEVIKPPLNEFTQKISNAIEFTGNEPTKNKNNLIKTLFARSLAWCIIQCIKANLNDFPLEFYQPTLAEANTSFQDLITSICKSLKNPSEISNIPIKLKYNLKGKKASDYFTLEQRARTRKGELKNNLVDIWKKQPELLTTLLAPKILSTIKGAKTKRSGFKHYGGKYGDIKNGLSRYCMVTQFVPTFVTDSIIWLKENNFVQEVNSFFDPCAGWFDRGTGYTAYVVSQKGKLKNPRLMVNDANPVLAEKYSDIYNHFKNEHTTLNSLRFHSFNEPIEDFPVDKIIKINGGRVTFAQTSPPYFNGKTNQPVESYPENADENGKTKQSSQYKTKEDWTNEFYHKFIYNVLSITWFFSLNVPAGKDVRDLVPWMPKLKNNSGRKSKDKQYSYLNETIIAMKQFAKTSNGYTAKFIDIGECCFSGNLKEAVYMIQVFPPCVEITRPLFSEDLFYRIHENNETAMVTQNKIADNNSLNSFSHKNSPTFFNASAKKKRKRIFEYGAAKQLPEPKRRKTETIKITRDANMVNNYPFGFTEIPLDFVVGDCLFNAISYYFQGGSPGLLRQETVKFMHLYINEFRETIKAIATLPCGNGGEIFYLHGTSDSYLHTMSQPQVWGGEIELKALAKRLGVIIVVISTDSSEITDNQVYNPYPSEIQPRIICLGYNGIHYAPINLPENALEQDAIIEHIYSISNYGVENEESIEFAPTL